MLLFLKFVTERKNIEVLIFNILCLIIFKLFSFPSEKSNSGITWVLEKKFYVIMVKITLFDYNLA